MYTRVIKEIGQQGKTDLRWSLGAVMALHTAAEHYCIMLFELSNLAAIHAHQITIEPKDIRRVETIHGEMEMINRPLEVCAK